MANQNGRVPKEAAQKFLTDHKLSQVVIIARTQCGAQVCVTEGLTTRDRENAAIAGEVWEQIINVGKHKGNLMEALRRVSR